MKFSLPLAVLMLVSLQLFSQQKKIVSGIVVDQSTQMPLSFASVSLQKSMAGTITNVDGAFDLHVPDTISGDTLAVSFLGYEMCRIAVSDVQNNVRIELAPYIMEMNEIVVHPLSAYDYIARVNENISRNYAVHPFETYAYYKEVFKENDNYVSRREGIFQSYFPGCTDTSQNEHCLVLFRQNDELSVPQFMNGIFVAEAKKQEDRAFENKPDTPKEVSTVVDFGGPNTILNFDFTKTKQTFLDPSKFDKYSYRVGETTVWQDRKVVKIHFETKKKVDNTLHDGYFLVDTETFAITSIESHGEYLIPAVLKPVLFVMGLSIEHPVYVLKVKYELINGLWYPKDFHGNITVSLDKKHLFSADEHADVEISQLFFISKTQINNAFPIALAKRYNAGVPMQDQVYTDGVASWEELNILKE